MQEQETAVALLPMDLKYLSKGALRILAQDPGLDPALLEQILIQEKDDPETVRCLIRNPALPDESFQSVLPELSEDLREEVNARRKALVSIEGQGLAVKKPPQRHLHHADKDQDGGGKVSLQQKIQLMSPGDKISFALKGTKEVRMVLIRDPNKEIAMTVLKNPKITETEIEYFAASTNVTEEVHREIGKNREWCKKYNVIRALVFNPKTPVGVSLEKLPYIKDKDLQFLSKSKNVPSAVSTTAKRLMVNKKRKNG
ncbi:MAG: hypothetical protein CO150_03935 [Nitrospirae bacterium CG_4_9_14_3_um_filter_53_35]|nr:MAG: hypothetical protein AUK29_04875 [Nitrospirae bacterium CG2_30_53_67]PIS37227.1 MAG: hypothetical protein COT35_07135 [Nitrospirae bacterium CG08_land_8_20_14_0_20_52_24]PIV83023.1 MAG: hypothetical protein COW52_10495 [Nitrospirae bacterium CG17_big_fil_post_rev_8_21_14_2_50_50_9]PIW85087.1 MAG: hypothetical protein COZ95_06460 [Nitrospirae bacterium CG_4_8_14_3_um_filter_50_41]PIX85954.1 MAG: hypothetical protein COZ32_05835 [Nitrospirae bacterium CG_4_10_14_3_um_filter_53_41]PJA7603